MVRRCLSLEYVPALVLLSPGEGGSQGWSEFSSPLTPKGESQTPPTSRTGEVEEAHQLKLSCSVFWKNNFLSMSLSFPKEKGRVVGGDGSMQG